MKKNKNILFAAGFILFISNLLFSKGIYFSINGNQLCGKSVNINMLTATARVVIPDSIELYDKNRKQIILKMNINEIDYE